MPAAPRPPEVRPFFARTPAELEQLAVELGGQRFHARNARQEILSRGVTDYAHMSALPRALRERMAERAPILCARETDRIVSSDGATKLLLAFERDAERDATVETVHIPSHRSSGATLCVSTQVGCPVGCPFCASGRAGLVRNLEAHEIVEQYLRGRALGPLARSVVMGIGEPLLNYPALAEALKLVHTELGLGARKITVSTVGYPDRLRRIAPTRPPFQLAISLHTPDDEQRAELVPAMSSVPIEAILAAGDFWFEETGREVTYEYVLLAGENDTPAHARRLIERLARRRCTVNLIPFNPVLGSAYGRPDPAHVEAFRKALEGAGVVTTVRWSRGLESDAACGQLRIRKLAAGT